MKIFYTACICLLILSTTGCKKDAEVFSNTPELRIVSVSPESVVEFQEEIIVVVEYTDGNGDLGNPDPDINSLFVKDARLANPDAYFVQPLAPVDANVPITGQLNVHIQSIFVFGNGMQETTTYEMYMVDREGNQSNTVITPEITIVQ